MYVCLQSQHSAQQLGEGAVAESVCGRGRDERGVKQVYQRNDERAVEETRRIFLCVLVDHSNSLTRVTFGD